VVECSLLVLLQEEEILFICIIEASKSGNHSGLEIFPYHEFEEKVSDLLLENSFMN